MTKVVSLVAPKDTMRPGRHDGARMELRGFGYMGLRRGEAVALRWEDVDFDLMTVNVRGTINRVPGVGLVTTLPKTVQSRRTVHLAGQLVEALGQHKLAQSAER